MDTVNTPSTMVIPEDAYVTTFVLLNILTYVPGRPDTVAAGATTAPPVYPAPVGPPTIEPPVIPIPR